MRVRWNGALGHEIQIKKGTRQGGISSPFLFNVFYQDMITILTETVGGIRIDGTSYSVFCYADDILVASTTTTGLQTLINVANNYLCRHGLTFNAAKTECITFGKTHFTKSPTWSIDSVILTDATETGIKYLGAVLSGNSAMQADSRIAACRRAYYMLQPSVSIREGWHQRQYLMCGGPPFSPFSHTLCSVWEYPRRN